MTDVEILRGESIKAGDTLPALRVQLFETGDPFNLADYDVTIHVGLAESDDLVVDTAATIEQPERGIVTYSWNAGETDDAGTYEIEFVAESTTNSETLTFPNDGYAKLYFEDRLG